MIKVNELRIGNYVGYQGLLYWESPVIRIDHEKGIGIEALAIETYKPEDIQGIPLNEESCAKYIDINIIDFRASTSELKNCIGTWGHGPLEYVIDSYCDEYGVWCYVTKEMDYLHNLQNLHFALTGKELTIKKQ